MPIVPEAGVRQLSRFALTLFSFFVLSASLWAQNTIRVPADQPTIQAAIDAASNGDTVLVSPGTYVENINFRGKAITVRSSNGAESTIIEGNNEEPVVRFMSGEGRQAVLSGFTVQHGGFSGVYVDFASPTISDNRIMNNLACFGGGIHLYSSSAKVRNNTISNNNVLCGSSAAGAGISIELDGSPEITGNTISNNGEFGNTFFGGGIAILDFSTPTVTNNIIKTNHAGQGGGIFAGFVANPTITQNLIVQNSAWRHGGGIEISFHIFGGGAVLTNNTVAYNISDPGPAVYLEFPGAQVSLFNNLLIANSGIPPVFCGNTGSSALFVDSNNVFPSPAYEGSCSDQTGMNGNISSDPLFVNIAESDYHLQPNSVAIDSGQNSALNIQQNDLDGNARITDGNQDGVATVDMGVYEAAGPASPIFSPDHLDFGSYPIFGRNYPTQTASFVNRRTSDFWVSFTQLTPNVGDFSSTNNCPPTLLPGASCVFTVTYHPIAEGPRTATVVMSGFDGQSFISVPLALAGIGGSPVADFDIFPGSLSFANQPVGTTSASQRFTVLSAGGVPLGFNSISTSGPFAAQYNLGCSGVAGPCFIDVTFTPVSRGAVTGALIIESNAVGSPHTFALSGTGIAPVAGVSASSLTFPDQRVSTPSSSQVVTLTNTGDAGLQLSGISANGDFTEANACGAALAPRASCTINVTFTPTTTGQRNGVLTISSNSFGSLPALSLTGTGVASVAAMSPQELSFAPQRVGTSSVRQPVSLTNTGSAPLNIFGFARTGDFGQLTTCGTVLAPGASCSINVSFVPRETGLRTGTLTIVSDSFEPAPVISLSGTGVVPVASLSPAALVFGKQVLNTQSHPPQAVILTNTGGAALQLSGFQFSGDFGGGTTCSGQIAPGASCALNVTFTPTATGLRAGTLTILSDSAVPPEPVSLSGTGVTGAPTLSPTSLSFGNVKVGRSSVKTVTLTASGPGPLTISAISISGDFTQTNNCPASLNAGSTCAISLIFSPTALGTRTGILSITDNGAGSPQGATLNGTGKH